MSSDERGVQAQHFRFEGDLYGLNCKLGRLSGSNQSPPIVSAKQEYSPAMPETFGNFRLKISEPGVRRRNRTRKKPGLPAHSRASWRAWPNARMAGWRGSADRTRLRTNSLLTGNFTGNFAIFGPFDPNPKRKTAAPQLFSSSSLRSLTGKTFRITGEESAVSGNFIKARLSPVLGRVLINLRQRPLRSDTDRVCATGK
jgi:hypothetical protein